MSYINKNDLSINSTLYEFVNKEILPGTDIESGIFWERFGNFLHRKLTLKVRILPFLTTFAQLSARFKKLFRGLIIGFGHKGRLGSMCNSVR